MPKRTQIVCICEGTHGGRDLVFINKVLKVLDPPWLRPCTTGKVRIKPQGGRTKVIEAMPQELKSCLVAGGSTKLIVLADLDHDHADGDSLKKVFWSEAQKSRIARQQFDQVIFIFAKDRIENWIQYLTTGSTNEDVEGPRTEGRIAADAADALAKMCKSNKADDKLPHSLALSCKNWRKQSAQN